MSVLYRVRSLLLLFPTVGAWLITAPAAADVKGIPFSGDFPTAAYPLARRIQQCTESQRPVAGRGDRFGVVDFTGACQKHDACYHTIGANWSLCNQAFLDDLRTSCDRDLEMARLEATPLVGRDLRAQHLCYEIADRYAARVQKRAAADAFAAAQVEEHRYLDQVRAHVRGLFKGVARRPAGALEVERALALLATDATFDDLRTALMGHRVDLLSRETEPLPVIAAEVSSHP